MRGSPFQQRPARERQARPPGNMAMSSTVPCKAPPRACPAWPVPLVVTALPRHLCTGRLALGLRGKDDQAGEVIPRSRKPRPAACWALGPSLIASQPAPLGQMLGALEEINKSLLCPRCLADRHCGLAFGEGPARWQRFVEAGADRGFLGCRAPKATALPYAFST